MTTPRSERLAEEAFPLNGAQPALVFAMREVFHKGYAAALEGVDVLDAELLRAEKAALAAKVEYARGHLSTYVERDGSSSDASAAWDALAADTDAALREVRAKAWDECLAAMRYEDGTPVEVVLNDNPYREEQ